MNREERSKKTPDGGVKEIKISCKWVIYAVAAVVIVGLVVVFNLIIGSADDLITQKLADGSDITLHGTSTIKTVTMNEELREVALSGKAYFDIQGDADRPFVIITHNARVKVLGTSFLIAAYNDKTEVFVESGLVALTKSRDKGKPDLSVKLKKGETGTVNRTNKGIMKKNNHDLNYLAWKTKRLVFDRSKMSIVATTLEDVYGITVQFENPELKDCSLTAKFNARQAKDAIEIIAGAFNLSYEIQNDSVLLKGKGC